MKSVLIVILALIESSLFAQNPLLSDTAVYVAREKNHRTLVVPLTRYLVPAGMLSYGLIAKDNKILIKPDKHLRHEMMEERPFFPTSIDDQLRYIPALAVYGLNIAGIKSKDSFIDRTAIYLLAMTIADNSVDIIKNATNRLRPDGSDRRSFPSGHTTTAFAAAEFMRQEYKDLSPWYGYAGYSVAVATGTLRMMNDKHWLSDVIAGAGLGILSTKLSYIVYPALKKTIIGNKKSNLSVAPVPYKGGGRVCYSGCVISRSFINFLRICLAWSPPACASNIWNITTIKAATPRNASRIL